MSAPLGETDTHTHTAQLQKKTKRIQKVQSWERVPLIVFYHFFLSLSKRERTGFHCDSHAHQRQHLHATWRCRMEEKIVLPGEAILFQVDEKSGMTQLCLRAFLRRRNDKMDSHTHRGLITAPATNLESCGKQRVRWGVSHEAESWGGICGELWHFCSSISATRLTQWGTPRELEDKWSLLIIYHVTWTALLKRQHRNNSFMLPWLLFQKERGGEGLGCTLDRFISVWRHNEIRVQVLQSKGVCALKQKSMYPDMTSPSNA